MMATTHFRIGRNAVTVVALACLLVSGQAQDNPQAVAIQLLDQGAKLYASGQYDRALTCFQRATDTFQRLGDNRGIGVGLNNMGLVFTALGQDRKALDCYSRSL